MKLGSAFLALISAAIIARGSAIETSLVEADGRALDTNGSRVAASEYGGDSFNYAGSFQVRACYAYSYFFFRNTLANNSHNK
jgi:hypothetical protein